MGGQLIHQQKKSGEVSHALEEQARYFSPYLTTSHHISLYLPIPPYTSLALGGQVLIKAPCTPLHPPTSPCISPYLPISPYLSAYVPGVDLRLHDGGGAARWRLGGRGRGDAS